jgi:FKBP-type peptidyl-prolyl cis-trans isomerase
MSKIALPTQVTEDLDRNGVKSANCLRISGRYLTDAKEMTRASAATLLLILSQCTLLAWGGPAQAPASAPSPASGSPAAASTDTKAQASRSIGLAIGQPLQQRHVSPQSLSMDEVAKGLNEALAGKALSPEAQQRVSSYLQSAASGAAATEAKAQASHDIGVTMGQRLYGQFLGSSAISVAELLAGVNDALAGKQLTEQDQQAIGSYLKGVREALAKKNEAAAQAFLQRNGKKAGVVTTASGLQYQVLAAGSGTAPQRSDTVSVTYTGKLLDGTEFDGTDLHGGQPISFPVSGVIAGWQEALGLMKPGARWQLFIPPKLAYGNDSSPPIPPGSLLVFTVELLKVGP